MFKAFDRGILHVICYKLLNTRVIYLMNSILLGQILSCLSSSHQEEHWNKNDVLTLVFSPFPYVFRILKTGSME